MNCANCGKEIAANSNFCYFCGSRQYAAAGAGPGATAAPSRSSTAGKRLYRSRTDKKIAGVLGGFAEYLGIDPTVSRVLYIVITFFTGLFPGILAYIIAWIVMSEAPTEVAANPSASFPGQKRLTRSATDRKWAGVCGGIGEYLGIDSTVVRLVWAILTVVPGAIVGGFLAYFIAWLVMPAPPAHVAPAAVSSTEPVPHSS